MKFENFLRANQGNEIEAAKALLIALRDERGIHLRYEALADLFNIGNEIQEQEGFKYQPQLVRHYAVTNDLIHPEEILNHLKINGIKVKCADYLKKHPLRAHFIDAKRTIRALKERKIIGEEKNVYDLVRDYYSYLQVNAIELNQSKFQETLNRTLIDKLTDIGSVANIIVDFELFVSLCSPKETSLIHPNYSRIQIGENWKCDRDRIAEMVFNSRNYNTKRSHGLCPDCYESIIQSIKKYKK